MNSARFLLTSSLLGFMCISPVVFAGYLTVNIEGHSDSGAFKLLIDKEAIQNSKLNQISVDAAGKSQSFHDTGVNVSFDIGRPGDLYCFYSDLRCYG